jgi:SAM-dependent methyltransferase
MSAQTYDTIGAQYAKGRGEDPRIARLILQALGNAPSVINVGAGTGSYEPRDRFVVAVEPSDTMIRQRRADAAPVVQSVAESLPFRDGAVASTLAILTLHHWSDRDAGISELCRVARERVVILSWDPTSFGFWLTQDYFPEFVERDRLRCPSLDWLTSRLRNPTVTPVPIPHDCRDGFLGAFWRRPAAYLDSMIRSGISSFAQSSNLTALRRLGEDLSSGVWEAKYGELLQRDELDMGYRIIAGGPRQG